MSQQFSNGYALLIGVGQHKAPKLNRTQPPHDVEDLRNLLIDPAYCGYPASQVEILINEQATQAAILTGLQTLANNIISKEATVMLMFSGHGYNQNGAYYFLPHDTQVIEGINGKIKRINTQSAIANETLVTHIRTISQRASKTLVIFHSCHSGGMGTPFSVDFEDEMTENLHPIALSAFDSSYQDLEQGKGTVILASSQQHQLSWAIGNRRNSLFMEQVLAVLKGEGIAPTEKYIELLPFIDRVKKSVREIAKRHELDQDPDYRVYGGMEGDFRIALRLGGQAMDISAQPAFADIDNWYPSKELSPKVKEMSGITPTLHKKLREVLTDCGPFSSNDTVQTTFADPRISIWQNQLHEGSNKNERVKSLINDLYKQFNISQQNALVLFLEVLIDETAESNACYPRLKEVALELAQEMGGSYSFSPKVTSHSSTPKTKSINIKVLHELLTKAFNAAELNRLLSHSNTSELRQIRNDFGPGMGLNDMVDQVIDHCERAVLLEQLLAEVKAERPRQYALYESKLY